jgi:hypothetical protein
LDSGFIRGDDLVAPALRVQFPQVAIDYQDVSIPFRIYYNLFDKIMP